MIAGLHCYYCCMKKAEKILTQCNVEEKRKVELMKHIFALFSKAGETATSSELMGTFMEFIEQETGVIQLYDTPKTQFNQMLLKMEPGVEAEIQKAPDALYSALQYALIGNYIDFGAMDTVEEETLLALLDRKTERVLDQAEYAALLKDLSVAKHLVYFIDNAGEIVLDKILIRILKQKYPDLHITAIVRGEPILNDATMKDAQEVGLTDIVTVLGNGTALPGTELNKISPQALEVIQQADVCIAKGQGNFETLCGEGLNTYFLFLCKCDLFVEMFQVNVFDGVFKHENTAVTYLKENNAFRK